MDKPTLYIMAGCQGCGKSYYAKKIQNYHEGCVLVSSDVIRFSLLNDDEDIFAHEKEGNKIYYDTIAESLRSGKDVIADATNLTREARTRLLNCIHGRGVNDFKTVVVWVEAPLNVALARNRKRTGRAKVKEEAIRDAYQRKISPDVDKFDKVVFISSDVNMAISTSDPEIKGVDNVLKNI